MSTTDQTSDGGTRSGGGRVPIGVGGSRDAGSGDAADVDPDDDALANECEEFPVAPVGEDTIPGMLLNAISSPSDFAVTRAVTTWEDACGQPTIRITLSDGECPDGRGHELSFYLPAEGIEDGTILTGQNLVLPDPAASGLRVRYIRPSRLSPSGAFGTCAEVNGTLDLIEVGTARGDALQGSFQLELTRCDGGDPGVQDVRGTFSVELRRGVDGLCPDAG